MKRIIIEKESLPRLDDREYKMLSLLANLEYCQMSLNLFRQEKKAQDASLHIFKAASSLYEALNTFDTLKKLVRDTIEEITTNGLDARSINESWLYLTSKETNLFRREVLSSIRNKSTFHVDIETVEKFFKTKKLKDSYVLWENNNENFLSKWHSPLARFILQADLTNHFKQEEIIDRLSDTFVQLSNLSRLISAVWFEVTITND